ncbi:MAG: trypsin-like serine protease [Colwellia sp.]
MNNFLLAILTFTISLPLTHASSDAVSLSATTKIVGGELTTEGDWPWMSALVYTYAETTTSLVVDDTTYDSNYFSYSPTGQASAAMVDCGIGDSQCLAASNKICLIRRGEIDFSVKANNCQASGGLGVIIYNNITGDIQGTLGVNFSGNIPVIAVSQSDGVILLNNLNSIATINISIQDPSAQGLVCGASFIGEKWLLTAAHCVEDISTDLFKVNIGEYNLADGANKTKTISRIYIHPEYNEGADFNNDIAILELTETIENAAVTLIDFADSKTLAQENSTATVLGWGNIIAYGSNEESPDSSLQDTLQQVELSLLSNDECQEKLAQVDNIDITDSMICAAFDGGGKGSCQGDSGGPLLVNTNLGWQQIGIVSYGIGCAQAEFPDVYSRVGNFTDWITSITQGVAIESNYDFVITGQYITQTTYLTVNNNSDLSANLTFTLQDDATSDSNFSLNSDSCTSLAAKQSCQLQVNFDASTIGQHNTQVIIASNEVSISTSIANISAQAIAQNSAIKAQLSSGSTELHWYSGGDQNWQLDPSDAAIISGDITGNQESSVMLTFTGAGSLSFDWAVSCETDIEAIDNPDDALYVIVDGKRYDFIYGEVAYNNITITDFPEGYHQVTWLYKQSALVSESEGRGYLKNVVFTPAMDSSVNTLVNTSVDSSTDDATATTTEQISSGGSVYSLLGLLALLNLLPRRLKQVV